MLTPSRWGHEVWDEFFFSFDDGTTGEIYFDEEVLVESVDGGIDVLFGRSGDRDELHPKANDGDHILWRFGCG